MHVEDWKNLFPLDTGFVLHQSLCSSQCPWAVVTEALAAIWGCKASGDGLELPQALWRGFGSRA